MINVKYVEALQFHNALDAENLFHYLDHNAEILAQSKAFTHIIESARLVMKDASAAMVDYTTNALNASLNISIIRGNV